METEMHASHFSSFALSLCGSFLANGVEQTCDHTPFKVNKILRVRSNGVCSDTHLYVHDVYGLMRVHPQITAQIGTYELQTATYYFNDHMNLSITTRVFYMKRAKFFVLYYSRKFGFVSATITEEWHETKRHGKKN